MGDFGGRYRRVKLLGAGGMGEVWLALDEQLGDRQVAIKIMRSHMLSDQDGQLRFQREMQLASQMSHPNIMLVLTSGTDQGVPFMVMEYLEGHDLRKVPPGLDAGDVARIGREICAALSYAHDQGVVHRDITPGNLFLCSTGLVKVTDFGIAKALTGSKITQSGTLVGTFPYMAPEQWLGEPATFSIDVWATGCVLYLLLSGRLPRDYSTAAEYVAAAVRGEQAAPPAGTSDVPSWLADAVVAMLEPDPRSRPTAAECVGLLSGSATDPGSNPKHSPPRPPAPRKVEYQPALGSGADPARAMRLLTDAEQMASAIGAAQALVRVAAVLAPVDAAHAARVLDDALHQRSGSLNAHLITSAAGDIGAVLARMDALPARRLLAEMEKVLQLAEDKTNSRRQLARLVATVDSGWAERVAHAEPDMAYRAAALDVACGVVASSDISRAEQIALTIPDSARPRALGSQLKQAIPGGKRQRASAARRGPELPRYSPGFHKARALAHLAVTAADGSDVPATPRLSAPPQFAPTVTNGQQGGRAPIRADDAQRLLTEAGHAASRLPQPGDDRAHALCEVQLAAVRVQPGDQDQFLAEAENYARAIADRNRRMGALCRLARVAAPIDPLRAAQIADALHPVQQYPVAILIAHADPVQAIRLLARSGNHYLAPVEKAIAATGTDPARLIRALSRAKPPSGQPLEFIQAVMLAAFIDVDWAEKALRSIRADTWGGYPGQTSYVRLNPGQLESMQAAGLADIANLLLGNRMIRD